MEPLKKRIAGVELLRIFLMLLIVLGHISTHGFDCATLSLTCNGLFTIAMSQGARIAVDVFVIITCYYSVRETIRWGKIKTLYREIWFYSVSILFLVFFAFNSQISPQTFARAFLPLYMSQYWFVTCFVGLMLLLPYLNVMFNNITRKSHKHLLLILTASLCVIPSVVQVTPPIYLTLICGS